MTAIVSTERATTSQLNRAEKEARPVPSGGAIGVSVVPMRPAVRNASASVSSLAAEARGPAAAARRQARS